MRRSALVLLVLVALAACDRGSHMRVFDTRLTDTIVACTSSCSPLTQVGCNAGEKCTWIVISWIPARGYIGCVGDGGVALGGACEYVQPVPAGPCQDGGNADNCVKGTVCAPLESGSGICEQVCDNAGGTPRCDDSHACVSQPGLFMYGVNAPAAAGVCVPACDPLADNDFDGPGSALARTGTVCGSANVGCYGAPSRGTPPVTSFTCMPDLHYATPLHHRAECTTANGCADPDGTIHANSCNQGYESLLYESTGVTTVVCVAFCSPLDCYAGNCGSGDVNRVGAAPHRCANPDALGSFGSSEECRYLWTEEIDGSGNWLPSPYSNSVGLCVDHDAFGMPACQSLPLDQAAALGCVSTQTAGLPRKRPELRASFAFLRR